MNLEKHTVKMTVRLIRRVSQKCGPDLFYLYVTVPTISPKKELKQSLISNPIMFATELHSIPTSDGWKSMTELRKGDEILFNLDLIHE